LNEEALDRTVWRARFVRGFGPVVRQTAERTNIYCTLFCSLFNNAVGNTDNFASTVLIESRHTVLLLAVNIHGMWMSVV
jgi:hypothetical protein